MLGRDSDRRTCKGEKVKMIGGVARGGRVLKKKESKKNNRKGKVVKKRRTANKTGKEKIVESAPERKGGGPQAGSCGVSLGKEKRYSSNPTCKGNHYEKHTMKGGGEGGL